MGFNVFQVVCNGGVVPNGSRRHIRSLYLRKKVLMGSRGISKKTGKSLIQNHTVLRVGKYYTSNFFFFSEQRSFIHS